MKKYFPKGKLIICIISILYLSACGGSSGGGENRIEGFYYSFDETGPTILDSSGNDYHGEALLLSRVEGKIGQAVKFLAEGSTIDLDYIHYYHPFETGFTFRSWVKIENPITSRQQIIGESTGSAEGFGISLIEDKISFEVNADQNILTSESAPLSFPIDTWFHIAVTHDGDALSMYYNGSLVATDSILSSYKPNFYHRIGNNRFIFAGVNIYDQFLETLDEFYLENRVMSSQEIMDYYLETM